MLQPQSLLVMIHLYWKRFALCYLLAIYSSPFPIYSYLLNISSCYENHLPTEIIVMEISFKQMARV
jgi:hypothetical protein